MPGLRDVVFIGVVGGGVVALAGHLWPPPPTRPATSYDAPAYTDADFGGVDADAHGLCVCLRQERSTGNQQGEGSEGFHVSFSWVLMMSTLG